jgi:3-hydroxybutyryl-CoA dehydrogenase
MTSPASTDQDPRTPVCRSLLVVGGGVMGQGIARLFANAGIRVTLVEPREIAFSHPGVTTTSLLPPEMLPDLVIEAVFEDLKVKQGVYADVEAAYGGRPALATNTSGLPLDDLAAPLRHPARFLAMHFFQPADVFPMIEVVRGTQTEDSAVAIAVAAVRQAQRDPILLERPINGYLINRLQHSILHEAYHLLESGIATAEMIDNVAKKLLGPRMCITGLLEQKDLAGLEMHAQAQRSIVPTLSHTGMPNAYLQDMVARGDVGIRSGRGFYDWRNRDGAATQRRASDRLQRLLAYLEKDAAE